MALHEETIYTCPAFRLVVRVDHDDDSGDPLSLFTESGDIVQIRNGHRWTDDEGNRGECDSVDDRFVLPRPYKCDGGWIAHTFRGRNVHDASEIKVWRALDSFCSDGQEDSNGIAQPRSHWIQKWRDAIDAVCSGDWQPYYTELVAVYGDGSEEQIDAIGMGLCASPEQAAIHACDDHYDVEAAKDEAADHLRNKAAALQTLIALL
jgi:hypothetical protein